MMRKIIGGQHGVIGTETHSWPFSNRASGCYDALIFPVFERLYCLFKLLRPKPSLNNKNARTDRCILRKKAVKIVSQEDAYRNTY